MVQISAKDKSHAAPDPKAGSKYAFLCADFCAFFQHPPISASFPDPHDLSLRQYHEEQFLHILFWQREDSLQNWSLGTHAFTEGNQ